MINKFVVSLIMIFILFISSSTAYSLDGDLVYIDDANVYLSSYPHTISSSGWVYFNFTSKVYTGDVDFCLGYDSEVVKPKKHELYNPHWVNWTTNHQAYFHNVSSITTYNGNDFDFGNSYNTYQRQVIYDQCINHNEFECTEYEQTTANCSFDSYTQDGSNYTIYWHTKHSRYELYSRFPYDPSHISYNFQDMTDWYYIQNVPIVQNQNYQMRVWIELPISLTGISSKYFFAIKPSGETIHQSITNGHFYYLDPWYQDSGYAYRKEINITGESGAGTHYQVNFTIGNASGGDFNLSGHSINFPSDVRFADDDGSTALNYWIEDETVDPIIAWVNVTDDLNTSQDIYVYYGKNGASSASNGEATFNFFDDFGDGNYDGWTVDAGSWTVVDDGAANNGKALHATASTSRIYANQNLGTGIYEMRHKISVDGDYACSMRFGYQGSDNYYEGDFPWSYSGDFISMFRRSGGATLWSESLNEAVGIAYHDYKIVWTDSFIKVYRDGVEKLSHSTDITTTSGDIWYRIGNVAPYNYIDFIRTRKYNSPEPAFNSAGAEESAPTDTTFTITLPVGYSYANFEPSNSTHKNCTPNGQANNIPFYNVTNTGDVSLDIRMKLNTTTTNIDLKADTDNNPTGATTITTSLQTIYSDLTVDAHVDIWLWSDFDHAIEQTTNKTLEINVTQ